MSIVDLALHAAPYVTVGDLADYWEATRRQISKHIETGNLPPMRLGPRCYRMRASDAVQFERTISCPRVVVPIVVRFAVGPQRVDERRATDLATVRDGLALERPHADDDRNAHPAGRGEGD